ncbi:MAG: GCN5-related N-acetyltransferase [Verrucomicrobia bacterium]|nr:GCN5-related N-acetyltransferase [Verrucomicrobiota bacterium]
MSENFITRAFVEADYDPVVKLWRDTDGVEVAEGDTRADIAAYLRRNPGLSCVAEVDGLVVAAVLCGHDGRRGLVYHLAVAQARRGRGIGRALLAECIDGLRGQGIKRVLLLVGKDNERGRAFWLAQGFEEIAAALPLGKDVG